MDSKSRIARQEARLNAVVAIVLPQFRRALNNLKHDIAHDRKELAKLKRMKAKAIHPGCWDHDIALMKKSLLESSHELALLTKSISVLTKE